MRRGFFDEYVLEGWRPVFWIAAVILLLYGRTLLFGFTYLDDKELIVSNYGFISSLSNIPQAFLSRVFPHLPAPYYRPLLTVTFMLDSKIGGTAPYVYHATNILIHAAACSLVFFFLLRIGLTRLASLFFSLFFAVHPALVHAVAWIPGRNDSLLAVCTLAAFISFLRYLDGRKRADLLFYYAFFALALFTKETAVMIVPLCLVYTKLPGRERLSRRELGRFAAGWLAIMAVWFVMRHIALQNTLSSTADSLAGAFFVSLPAVIQYIGKIAMPFNLSVFPTIRDTTFLYGGASIILIAAALMISKEKDRPLILFGLVWFALFLAPSLVRPSAAAVLDFQEHRLYLSMVGAVIVLSQIDCFKRIPLGRATTLFCLVLLFIFAVINVRYAGNFRDGIAYWRNATETSPHSWLTHYKRAMMYSDLGSLDEAEREFLQAIALDHASSPAYAGLGNVYAAKKMPKEAEPQLKKALAICPLNYPCYISLGNIYYKEGRLKEAAAMWIEALKIVPSETEALKNMAILCVEQKDYKAARFYVTRLQALGVEPPAEFLKRMER